MIKIALLSRSDIKSAKEITQRVIDHLSSMGVMVVLDDQNAANFNMPSISSVDFSELQFLISMGGDGTILRWMHHFKAFDIPIIGINLGHLGFMADIPLDDLEASLTDLLQNKYQIENRIILEASLNNQISFAINDVVLHRARNPSLVEFAIKVDGRLINNIESDGIIIATPNGSTAYSLAAGGPILTPNLDAVVITPICAHTISNRPIVLNPDQEIQIEYLSPYQPLEVTVDGMELLSLKTNQVLTIKKHPDHFKIVRLLRHDYFTTLRTKLGWVGKLR